MKETTVLKFRAAYKHLFPIQEPKTPSCLKDKDKIQQIIYSKILDDKPLMVARFGSYELSMLENLLMIKGHRNNWKYICWKGEPNYLHNALFESFCNNAFFSRRKKSKSSNEIS